MEYTNTKHQKILLHCLRLRFWWSLWLSCGRKKEKDMSISWPFNNKIFCFKNESKLEKSNPCFELSELYKLQLPGQLCILFAYILLIPTILSWYFLPLSVDGHSVLSWCFILLFERVIVNHCYLCLHVDIRSWMPFDSCFFHRIFFLKLIHSLKAFSLFLLFQSQKGAVLMVVFNLNTVICKWVATWSQRILLTLVLRSNFERDWSLTWKISSRVF